jgi:hypothetical protein
MNLSITGSLKSKSLRADPRMSSAPRGGDYATCRRNPFRERTDAYAFPTTLLCAAMSSELDVEKTEGKGASYHYAEGGVRNGGA